MCGRSRSSGANFRALRFYAFSARQQLITNLLHFSAQAKVVKIKQRRKQTGHNYQITKNNEKKQFHPR